MTDRLGEALAWYDKHNPNGSVDQMYPIVAAARNWHALTNPTDELIERVADLAGERNGFWQPRVAAAYIAAVVDALDTATPKEET